jgi:hypothetical protein
MRIQQTPSAMKKFTCLTALLFVFIFLQKGNSFAQKYQADTVHKNAISYSISGLMVGQIAIYYERSFTKNLTVNIPFAYGDLPPSNCGESFVNIFYTGVNVNYSIPSGRNLRYFAGIGFRCGLAETSYTKCSYGDYTIKTKDKVQYYKFFLNNGITFNLWKRVPVRALLSIGPRIYRLPDAQKDKVNTTAYFTVNLGYRF